MQPNIDPALNKACQVNKKIATFRIQQLEMLESFA